MATQLRKSKINREVETNYMSSCFLFDGTLSLSYVYTLLPIFQWSFKISRKKLYSYQYEQQENLIVRNTPISLQ